MRVKQHIKNYYITGEIDNQSLPRIHNICRSPSATIKLVQNEFKIEFGRTTLPAGEQE